MTDTSRIKDPERVLLVSPFAHYAGHHWRDTYTLANALSASGVAMEAIVATTPSGGGQFPGPVHLGLPTWWHRFANWITGHGRRPKILRLLNNLETMACMCRALPDAMASRETIIHLLGGTHLFILLFALCSRRPVFLSVYGDFLPPKSEHPTLKERFRDSLLHPLLKARKLILICETESLRRRWQWLFHEDVHTIPYAVSVPQNRESKASARAALGLPEEGIILLLFGTQRDGKDYGVVLRAASLLQPAVHLLFVGKTISQNNPQVLARELGFQQATFIDRFVDEAEVPRFFYAADAAVLPYEKGFDRGSGVIVDTCSFGRPIITSRTGYLEWFIETHGAGFLYEPEDTADLAKVIQRFMALDVAGRNELEAKASHVADLHSWPRVTQEYLSVYRQYIGSSS